jgi:hypothetical protein
MMYKHFDLTAKHFHIEDRLPLTRDIFENWMENNLNAKALVVKIFRTSAQNHNISKVTVFIF